eukprot:COSAG04_NODE_114_length_25503_cov_39.366832_1_plen_193_part_00
MQPDMSPASGAPGRALSPQKEPLKGACADTSRYAEVHMPRSPQKDVKDGSERKRKANALAPLDLSAANGRAEPSAEQQRDDGEVRPAKCAKDQGAQNSAQPAAPAQSEPPAGGHVEDEKKPDLEEHHEEAEGIGEAEVHEMNRLMELLDRGAATEADLNRVKGFVSKFASGESQNSVRILPSACFCCAAREA